MFFIFKQIQKNALKSRQNNGLFFGSLIIAIVAFYTLLSLEEQDVMIFLKTLESDAISKLMKLIPLIYICSLFFVFFLVYFAYYYQLDYRKKEFGLYLMLGMKRFSLLTMLMGETIWNSFFSILLGLPIALLLTEGISLTTGKLVGLGIIGHTISFSWTALFLTVLGFISIQLLAMLFLSTKFSQKEPAELLKSDSPTKQTLLSRKKGILYFMLGSLLLLLSYIIGVSFLRSLNFMFFFLTFFFVGSGTFLFYRGLGVYIGQRIHKKASQKAGLYTFTGRQIQENVLYQHRSLAISSLLLMIALSCLSFGIGIASGHGATNTRTVDFSASGDKNLIQQFYHSDENKKIFQTYYPLYLNNLDTETYNLSWKGLYTALQNNPETSLRDNMIENFSNSSNTYLISLSSYNKLLQSLKKAPIKLEENQAAFYTSIQDNHDFINNLQKALQANTSVTIGKQTFDLLPELYYDNIVADRKITLYASLIVTDKTYQKLACNHEEIFCWNFLLNQDLIDDMGFMQSIQMVEKRFEQSNLPYESYLRGIGRNLFYTVSTSYLTIYLGILFIIIANTVISLKYLMQQRKNQGRYLTLLMLGAQTADLCKSSKKQIKLFFMLVLGVAICNSIFAIISMFTSFLKLPVGTSIPKVFILTGLAFLLFLLLEFIYIKIIEHINHHEIEQLAIENRRNVI